ncbi:glycoside hydrolase family 12 protein [Prauserella shujinwangii]
MLMLTLQAPVAHAATWYSSDRWGSWSQNGYTVRNNVWGSGHGPQTVWANSYGNWGVWADHPNTGGVKSYPHVARNINRKVSALGRLRSGFDVRVPGSGAYATAYDIWAGNGAYEIMLWMNQTGPVGPIGSWQATASVGGHTWDVYRGSNGHNAVFSFVRQGNVRSGTVDIKAVLDWIRSRGWFGDVTVGDVQFGFEITSSSGGLDFVSNSYSVTTG